jgi:hypothetical protein
VQSLLVLGEEPEVVNSSGNHIHFLGFGYVGGYRRARARGAGEPREITYASGACVLLPARVLRQVGLFDETLWLYHEDLDLGWRIRLAGLRNLIAPASVCRHFYEFSRSQSKWYWMERNRWIVVLKNYRLATILLLLPVLLVADLGSCSWLPRPAGSDPKCARSWFLRPSAWRYLWRGRRDIARIRRVPDRELLRHFTAVIDFPDFRSPVITKVIEPVWKAMLAVLRTIVRWYHAQAKTLARSWEKSGQALVTTDAVLIEFANFFARSPLRALAASWLRRLRQCVHPPVRPLAAA